jgi:hypothetical protein
MQLAIPFLFALFGVYSATASPDPQDEGSRDSCIVPEIFFTSLPNPFTLAALVPGPSTSTQQASWPVQLSPRAPSKEVISKPIISKPIISKPIISKPIISKPIISRTKIMTPSFRLVNETLVTAEGDFPPPIYPPSSPSFRHPSRASRLADPMREITPASLGPACVRFYGSEDHKIGG